MTQTHMRLPDAKVMVVEDEPRLRDLLTRAITGWGFMTTAARSGEEAIRHAPTEKPDIAVLDLNLPGIGGLETLQRLREQLPNIQAMVLTGFASIDAAKEAVHLDVVEFLTKPCHLGELEKALDRALRRLPVPPSAAQELLGLQPPEPAELETNPEAPLHEIERQHILTALRRHAGNRTATAQALGISRRTLYYKLEEYQKQGFQIE
jgi:DNA-binding NtrC family response regulator